METVPGISDPLVLIPPSGHPVPVLLTSPHSGRNYPQAFLAASRLNALSIRRSEDSFVEELFAAGPALGMPLLAATFPRAFCDANREPWELDPEMFEDPLPEYVNATSPRVTLGLGTVARIVATGESIYRDKLRFADAQARVQQCWEPFHNTLRSLISATREAFGACLILDCHSMPRGMPHAGTARPADIILGDGYGSSCGPEITSFAETTLAQLGFVVGRNDPYSGGYITRHYGRPGEGVHVLQVELARSLYMDEFRIERKERFAAVREQIGGFLTALTEAVQLLLSTSPEGCLRIASAAE